MKIKNIVIFLIITYFSLDFVIPGFYEKDIVNFCSERGKNNQFLSNGKFRNCIVDSKFRGRLIDKLIVEQKSETSSIVRHWKENFNKYNDLFIKDVKSIGFDKFKEIDFPLYGRTLIDLDYKYKLPIFVKVRMDCSMHFDSCYIQYIGNTELDGHWNIEFDKFFDIYSSFFSITANDVPMDLYLMSTHTPKEIIDKYKFNLIGFNVNLNSIIESIRRHSDEMAKHYNKYR